MGRRGDSLGDTVTLANNSINGNGQATGSGLTKSLEIADLNGDGKPDVVTADNFRNQLSVLLYRLNGWIHMRMGVGLCGRVIGRRFIDR